ncbi:hypothetical protein ACFQXA_33340 [Nocardiopsis composta]
MPRRLLAGACAALLAVAASACGGSDTETTEDGLTKITVGAIPIVDVAPFTSASTRAISRPRGSKSK